MNDLKFKYYIYRIISIFYTDFKKTCRFRSEQIKFHNKKKLKSPFFKIYDGKGVPYFIDQTCIIHDEMKFMYCRIPKAANSTVVASLYNAMYGKRSFTREEMKYTKSKIFNRLSNLNENKISSITSDYYSFTIVRNPYDRFISAYLDKIFDTEEVKHRAIVADYLNKDPADEINVDEFLDYLENGNGLNHNYHWVNQKDLLALPINNFSYVGKVENLENDLSHILKEIFRKNVPIITWRPHSTKKISGSIHLNSDQKRKIYNLYYADFELFQYLK